MFRTTVWLRASNGFRNTCLFTSTRSAISWKSKLQRQTQESGKMFDLAHKFSVKAPQPRLYIAKKLVIQESKKYAIFQNNGKVEVAEGPCSRFLFMQRAACMNQVIASPDEYLRIKHKNGQIVHESGPVSTWIHPSHHEKITVMRKESLETGQAMVVYTSSSNPNEPAQRQVYHGPCKIIIGPNQWAHNFSWSNEHEKIEFTKLQTSNSIEICLEGLRTKCNATLSSLKLNVSFRIYDIELMLQKSNNPVTDFTSAVSADLLNYVGKVNITEFKDQSTELNSLTHFPITQQRAKDIGLSMENADFCGYSVSDSIQQLLDKEIHASISKRIKAQEDEQRQASLDYTLEKEALRQKKQLELQRAQVDSELEQLERKEKIAVDSRLHEQQASFNQKINYLKQIKKIGVDVTQVLVAENQGNFTKEVFHTSTPSLRKD